jgi:hypothetical protein
MFCFLDWYSLICTLLFSSSPPAVVWRVWEIVVDTVYGSALGAITHVLNEGVEALPPVADSDAAPTVVGVVDVLGGCAASPHGVPRPIGWVGLLVVLTAWEVEASFTRFGGAGLATRGCCVSDLCVWHTPRSAAITERFPM